MEADRRMMSVKAGSHAMVIAHVDEPAAQVARPMGTPGADVVRGPFRSHPVKAVLPGIPGGIRMTDGRYIMVAAALEKARRGLIQR